MENGKAGVTMTTEEKLTFLKALIRCNYEVGFREYDGNGTMLNAEPASEMAEELFEKCGCLRYALDHSADAPVFLSSGIGLLWGAVSVGTAEERRLHVIGPVLNKAVLPENVNKTMHQAFVYLDEKIDFRSFLAALPIIPMQMFQHYILMLNLALTGREMHANDILYQTAEQTAKSAGTAQKRNRHLTYMAEQALLYNVREGNLDYARALARSSSLSTGVQIQTENPISQATISVVVFTSLCVREAIKGGLSPDTAYAVGDAYIQNMVEAKTISMLGALSHAMYTDFIRRVRQAKADKKYSKTVQECCDYILTHMADELSAAVLAQQFGYTPYYLSRKFKTETGMTLAQYIDLVRIEKAKTLLESTMDSIAEIARELRYCSSTYFSETFRKIVGMLPSEYRKS